MRKRLLDIQSKTIEDLIEAIEILITDNEEKENFINIMCENCAYKNNSFGEGLEI